MMTKRCIVCRRDFDEQNTRCFSCELPLQDLAAPAPIQEIELSTIRNILLRRWNDALRQLRPPDRIRRPEPLPNLTWNFSLIVALRRLVIWIFSPSGEQWTRPQSVHAEERSR